MVSVSCIHRHLIKIGIVFKHRPQVHLKLCCIVTMEKVAVAPTASKYDRKRLIENLDRAKDVTS